MDRGGVSGGWSQWWVESVVGGVSGGWSQWWVESVVNIGIPINVTRIVVADSFEDH